MIDKILNFTWKYLAGPVVADARGMENVTRNGITASTGYNLVNTVAWMLLAGLIIYLVYQFFERRDLGFDMETALYSTPFVLLGGVLRFLDDAAVIQYPLSILLITPVIYIVIAAPYLAVSYFSEEGNWERNLLYTGAALLVPSLVISFTGFQNLRTGLLIPVVLVSGVLTALFYAGVRDTVYDRLEYHASALSQFFGGAVSMLAVENGYVQKQLLAQYSTQLMGSPGILVVKAAVLGLALYTVQDMDDDRMSGLIILGLLAIGLGTGLRVLLRLVAGL